MFRYIILSTKKKKKEYIWYSINISFNTRISLSLSFEKIAKLFSFLSFFLSLKVDPESLFHIREAYPVTEQSELGQRKVSMKNFYAGHNIGYNRC